MSLIAKDWHKIVDDVCNVSNPLLVIVGPTASGKTGLSFQIVEYLQHKGVPAEIVNADSRQLYKGADIGTAKPTTEEQARVVHHLLDIAEPTQKVTAAEYKRLAEQAIRDIQGRGALPILVGGSMLFISAVADGLTFAPVVDASVREAIENEYDNDNGESLFAELSQADPDTAAMFHKNNKPYLVRAIEILRVTGKKPSAFKKKDPQFDAVFLGVDLPKDVLDKRIIARIEQMLAAGWIDEVARLIAQGVPTDAPAMLSVGYPNIAAHLTSSSGTESELVTSIAEQTRKYAKRQRTWWKGDDRIHWITPVL